MSTETKIPILSIANLFKILKTENMPVTERPADCRAIIRIPEFYDTTEYSGIGLRNPESPAFFSRSQAISKDDTWAENETIGEMDNPVVMVVFHGGTATEQNENAQNFIAAFELGPESPEEQKEAFDRAMAYISYVAAERILENREALIEQHGSEATNSMISEAEATKAAFEEYYGEPYKTLLDAARQVRSAYGPSSWGKEACKIKSQQGVEAGTVSTGGDAPQEVAKYGPRGSPGEGHYALLISEEPFQTQGSQGATEPAQVFKGEDGKTYYATLVYQNLNENGEPAGYWPVSLYHFVKENGEDALNSIPAFFLQRDENNFLVHSYESRRVNRPELDFNFS